MTTRQEKRVIRHKRVKAKIIGTSERPRFSVFRSDKHLFLQIIDDARGETLVSASDMQKAKKDDPQITKTDKARALGKNIAKQALIKKIEQVVFDRGGYLYHGRVKAVAEGAREGGLKF